MADKHKGNTCNLRFPRKLAAGALQGQGSRFGRGISDPKVSENGREHLRFTAAGDER